MVRLQIPATFVTGFSKCLTILRHYQLKGK